MSEEASCLLIEAGVGGGGGGIECMFTVYKGPMVSCG